MSDLQDLVKLLTAATTKIAEGAARFQEALRKIGDTEQAYREHLTNTEVEGEVAGQVGEVNRLAGEVTGYLEKVVTDVATYTASLGSVSAPEEPPAASPTPTGTKVLDPVEAARATLPPPVGTDGQRQKTHGRWLDANGGAHAMISEKDGLEEKATAILREAGCPKLPITASADVELRLAVLMRERGGDDPDMRNLTLVINNTPCVGQLGCDSLLPVILPEGYTLTVHGTNGYVQTYTGGGKPWWR